MIKLIYKEMKGTSLQRGSHGTTEEGGHQENQRPLRSGLKYDLHNMNFYEN